MSANVIIPGDTLSRIDDSTPLVIGPGIYKDPKTQELIPTTAGIISNKKTNTKQILYTESNSKRYIPQVNDFVIGVITGTVGETYKVQLQNFSQAVLLPFMAFPNASRKNRPNLKTGQVVYARVSQAIADIDIEIECVDPTTGKDGGFGLLDESGYVFEVNLNFARELLFNANSLVLEKLATRCKFEIAVGMNGKIWLKCGDGVPTKDNQEDTEMEDNDEAVLHDLKTTLAASRYLIKCQYVSPDQFEVELKSIFKGL